MTAKANGKILGRKVGSKIETKKAIENKAKIIKLSKWFNGTLKDTALDNECSMRTILKYIKLQKPYKGYYYRYKEKDNEQTT